MSDITDDLKAVVLDVVAAQWSGVLDFATCQWMSPVQVVEHPPLDGTQGPGAAQPGMAHGASATGALQADGGLRQGGASSWAILASAAWTCVTVSANASPPSQSADTVAMHALPTSVGRPTGRDLVLVVAAAAVDFDRRGGYQCRAEGNIVLR